MSFTSSPAVDQVFIGLKAWIQDALGLSNPFVVRELGNGVPPPNGPYVCMTQKGLKKLGMNVTNYQPITQESILQAFDFTVQVDCYGPASSDWAVVLSTVWQHQLAVDFMAAYGVTPLWAEDPIEMPVVNGEQQYEKRWIVQLHLQYQPSTVAPQQFMAAASIVPISVETLH
jgi:hypothetical protein